MSTIKFLTVVNDQGAAQQIDNLFFRFQQKSGVSVVTNFFSWDMIWRELVNVGIYRRGADLAEVGTTWLESLVAMNALRPFSTTEINRLGGKNAFIPATWTATSISGDARVWGIPIRCDVRVIWYWKDMLEQVKVDPARAFVTPVNTRDTLEKLKTVTPTPWGVATAFGDPNILQTLATWLWASKGDFINAGCDEIMLMRPEALEALRNYFGLYRYMPLDNPELSGADLFELFTQRKLAAIVGGPWTRYTLAQQDISEEEITRIGIAVMPGPAFVGGTVLSIWQHSRCIKEIMKLIEFLVQPEMQLEYCPFLGLLPTRHAAWEMPTIADDPYYQVIYQVLSMGRGLPAVPLWGMVEEKLKNCFSLIWKDLLTNPDADIDQTIRTYLEPTVTRLNLSLK